MPGDGEFELEVSSDALAVVDRWLGIKHTDEIATSELPEQRPMRLGLGAKFLPHKLVLQRQSEQMEKKLQNKLKRKADYEEEDVAQVSDDAGDDDDDERERGFNSKKRRVDTRVDALALLAKDSKKKKSKKKNKSKGNGSEEDTGVAIGAAVDKETIAVGTEARPSAAAEESKQLHARDIGHAHQGHHHKHAKEHDAPPSEPGDDAAGDAEPSDLSGWGVWAEPDSASHGGDGAFDMEVVAKAEAHFGGRSSTSAIPGPQSTAKATVIAAAGPSQQKEEDVEEGKPHVHPSRTIAANRASPHVHGAPDGKKKKVRSKQKNIKKDNRAPDQKPPHLRNPGGFRP